MPYFLNHHFDPDFNHQRLSPKARQGGAVDHRKLGYVQNVMQGDVLANWLEIPPGEEDQYDERFIYDAKEFPIGRNCRLDKESPDILLAGANGYVFYLDGTINVKKVLNVRRDVDYHTGNIQFVSDIIVHGTVRSGFEIKAENIRVYENINGAKILANKALKVDGGIKGSKKADIRARETIRAKFCENAILRAGRDILIDGACYHSDLMAFRHIVVKGRLQGGNVYAPGRVLVQERVGCGLGGKTSIILGFNPSFLRAANRLGRKIAGIKMALSQMEGVKESDTEKVQYFESLAMNLEELVEKQRKAWQAVEESFSPTSSLVVPGEVLPGLDVSIGPAHYRVEEPLHNVRFFLRDNEVCYASPALEA